MKTLAIISLAASLVATAAAAAPSFDRKAWREDYATLKRELEHSYSHLPGLQAPRVASIYHRSIVARGLHSTLLAQMRMRARR
jgi:hypothetical protein